MPSPKNQESVTDMISGAGKKKRKQKFKKKKKLRVNQPIANQRRASVLRKIPEIAEKDESEMNFDVSVFQKRRESIRFN